MKTSEEIEIRPYDPARDLDGVCRTFKRAFHRSYWPMFDEADPQLARDVVGGLTSYGNGSTVAEAAGRIVGFLIGYADIELEASLRAGAILFGRMAPGLALGRYHASRRARRFLYDVARDFLPFVALSTPRTWPWCEVQVFGVDPDCQGRGVGQRLMDRFVSHAEEAGVHQVLVVTDTTLSWRFYPSYGFRRVTAAPIERAYQVSIPGEDVTALIYSLDLDHGGSSHRRPEFHV